MFKFIVEVNKVGKVISDYTEASFLEFVRDIYNNNKVVFPTEESHVEAVLEGGGKN